MVGLRRKEGVQRVETDRAGGARDDVAGENAEVGEIADPPVPGRTKRVKLCSDCPVAAGSVPMVGRDAL
jgi:hypothetical protein